MPARVKIWSAANITSRVEVILIAALRLASLQLYEEVLKQCLPVLNSHVARRSGSPSRANPINAFTIPTRRQRSATEAVLDLASFHL